MHNVECHNNNFIRLITQKKKRWKGHAVAQLVEDGRGFDSRFWHWNFLIHIILSHYGHGVDTVSNGNEYQ